MRKIKKRKEKTKGKMYKKMKIEEGNPRVAAQTVGPETQKNLGPGEWGPTFRAFFSLSRRKCRYFFSLRVLFVELWPRFKAVAHPKCTFRFVGVILCEPQRPTKNEKKRPMAGCLGGGAVQHKPVQRRSVPAEELSGKKKTAPPKRKIKKESKIKNLKNQKIFKKREKSRKNPPNINKTEDQKPKTPNQKQNTKNKKLKKIKTPPLVFNFTDI